MTKTLTKVMGRSPVLDGLRSGSIHDFRITPRRGFTLVELIGTCLLLGILFSTTIPMLLVITRERKSTEQRQFALQHVANLIEYAAEKPWSELSSGNLTVPDVDRDLQAVLPGLERIITVKTSRRRTRISADYCVDSLEKPNRRICFPAQTFDLGLFDE